MILLWGLAGDAPIASVRSMLARLGRNALLLDQRAVMETQVELAIDTGVSGCLAWGAVQLDLARVTAVYLRPYDPFGVPEIKAAGRESPAGKHALAVYEVLRHFAETTPARVVNRLSAMGSNGSKPYQMALIEASGFDVPETLVTTDPEEAEAFCAGGETIYKSVSGIRSIVARITPADRTRLQAVSACPTQFQRWVAGVDHRVHVVGEATFCCELVSSSTDYRYVDREGGQVTRRQVELPADIANRCVRLAANLGLPVAGIDLRCTPEGRWVCFEVNPSPAFSFFDGADGRIATAIAGYLAAAPR